MAWDIGDVVRLKSGGPRMVVIDANPVRCDCAWFIAATVRKGTFPNMAVMLSNGESAAEQAAAKAEAAEEAGAQEPGQESEEGAPDEP